MTPSLCGFVGRIQSFLSPFANLLLRIAVAYPFFASGLTKWNYFINDQLDTLVFLFEDYNIPILPLELAAIMATFGELILPILLVLGLLMPISTLGLLIMTAFIYNADQNPDTLYWGAILIYLFINGASKISLDSMICKKICKV